MTFCWELLSPIQYLACLVSFQCILGGTVEFWTKNILHQFIDIVCKSSSGKSSGTNSQWKVPLNWRITFLCPWSADLNLPSCYWCSFSTPTKPSDLSRWRTYMIWRRCMWFIWKMHVISKLLLFTTSSIYLYVFYHWLNGISGGIYVQLCSFTTWLFVWYYFAAFPAGASCQLIWEMWSPALTLSCSAL